MLELAISRTKVLSFLNRLEESVTEDDLISETAKVTIECVRRYIESIPIIDAVPVVTCERCRYSDRELISDGRSWCCRLNSYMRYCSEGYCREDGDNDVV